MHTPIIFKSPAHLERASAAQITKVVKVLFGQEFWAVARKGQRYIQRQTGPLAVETVGSGKVWSEAIRQAKETLRRRQNSDQAAVEELDREEGLCVNDATTSFVFPVTAQARDGEGS